MDNPVAGLEFYEIAEKYTCGRQAATGAIEFRYDPAWLAWDHTLPVSLSLPLREDAFRGDTVTAVVDNLLPDSDALRRRVAEKVGAAGTDAYRQPSAATALARCSL